MCPTIWRCGSVELPIDVRGETIIETKLFGAYVTLSVIPNAGCGIRRRRWSRGSGVVGDGCKHRLIARGRSPTNTGYAIGRRWWSKGNQVVGGRDGCRHRMIARGRCRTSGTDIIIIIGGAVDDGCKRRTGTVRNNWSSGSSGLWSFSGERWRPVFWF